MSASQLSAGSKPAWTIGCSAAAPASTPADGTPVSLGRSWLPDVRRLVQTTLASSDTRDARQNALVVFAIRVASAGLLFASQILLARWMGAADYGIYVSLWTAVLVIGGLSHLGLGMTMMRLAPQYTAEARLDELRGLIRGGRLLAFALPAAVALVAAGLIWTFRQHFSSNVVVPMLLMTACIPMYALTEVQDGLGRGQSWTLTGLVPPYLLRPLLVLLFAGGAYLLALPADAVVAMSAVLAATYVAALIQLYLIQRCLKATLPPGPRHYDLRKWLGISLPLVAVGGCELALQNTDVLMLNLFRPAEDIGIYYAAAKTTTLALFVHYAVGSAFAGRFAAAGATGDREELNRLVREAVRWTFWPTLAIVATVLAAGIPLLSLFGPGFTDAYPIMFVLSIGMLARASMGPSEIVLNMLGEQRACARAFGAAAVTCIVLNALLIPWLGPLGAGIGTAAAFTTAAILNWRNAHRLLGIDVFVFSNLFTWRRAS